MNYHNIQQIVRSALKEDIGKRDITTELTIPKNKLIDVVLLAKEDGIICGLEIAKLVFRTQDKNIKFRPQIKDGDSVKKGRIFAKISGRASSILAAERVALNFLSLLSGIATKTKKYVEAVKPYNVKIMDTRKTIPGLRELEKYAVRVGEGYNHRFRLDEMVLIKDNHLVASCVKKLIEIAKKKKPKNIKLEIEVRNWREFKEALKAKPDIIMLDNMKIDDIKKAVEIRPKTLLEASGGINLKNIKKIAATGVDMISVGDLTHSVKSIDMSLEIL